MSKEELSYSEKVELETRGKVLNEIDKIVKNNAEQVFLDGGESKYIIDGGEGGNVEELIDVLTDYVMNNYIK